MVFPIPRPSSAIFLLLLAIAWSLFCVSFGIVDDLGLDLKSSFLLNLLAARAFPIVGIFAGDLILSLVGLRTGAFGLFLTILKACWPHSASPLYGQKSPHVLTPFVAIQAPPAVTLTALDKHDITPLKLMGHYFLDSIVAPYGHPSCDTLE